MTSSVKTGQFKFTGKHMLITMVSFFLVIITVNMTMAMMASKSWTGLVVKNSYVASQKYNDHLTAAKVQQLAGLKSTVTYKNGVLTFALTGQNAQPLEVKNLSAEIGRPAFEQADKTIVFNTDKDDTYLLNVDMAPGIWSVKITGQAGDIAYRRDLRVFVDTQGNGRVQ